MMIVCEGFDWPRVLFDRGMIWKIVLDVDLVVLRMRLLRALLGRGGGECNGTSSFFVCLF